MRKAVADLAHPEAIHLDFYDSTRMATWVRDHPGEVLWVRARIGQPLHGWEPCGNWSRAPDPEGKDSEYLKDDTTRIWDGRHKQDGPLTILAGIRRLRSALREPRGIVRLTGLSGTGKTRLLEALFDASIGDDALDPALAIYVDIGHEPPEPGARQLAVQLAAQGQRTIMLVDNCPRKTHDELAGICNAPNSPLSLITVDLDIQDETPEHTNTFRLEAASETVIAALLARRFPGLAQNIRDRIAAFSGGNARLANLAAENVAPDANLATLTDNGLFEKLFWQNKARDDILLRAAEACALVYSFDCETFYGDAAELPFLAALAELSPLQLSRHVAELKRREIVQARGPWRAILPQPLANWLACRALQNLPPGQVADRFWHCGQPRLLKSFSHRLSYLHDSPEARQIAQAWLGGPLANLQWLDRFQVDLVQNLAPVDPAAALDLIERNVMGENGAAIVARDAPNRDSWMRLLRSIAYFPEYFARATRLLSRFVIAELEDGK